MSLENIFVFRRNSNGSFSYIPASGLLFGLGASGTVVLGDATNKITGIYNSILGGSLNCMENANVSRSVIGGGSSNKIIAGDSNFITAGNSNWISGVGNSLNTIVGGCSNTIIGNQSLIGGGCGNFLGAGTGEHVWRGANTNVIVGGQYNCSFAANPRDASSIYNTLNGWNGVSFDGLVCYNPPSYGVIVAGLQNRLGGCASFVGAGTDNWNISDKSVIVGGCSNKNKASNGYIGGGECNAMVGTYNVIDNGYCNRIGLEFSETILNPNAFKTVCYGYIGNGFQNRIIGSCYASIVGGRNNRICASPDGTLVGGTQNCLASCAAFLGGGENNCVFGYHATIGGGQSNKALGNCSAILGGKLNVACAGHSTVLAGYNTSIDNTHEGAVVIADSQDRFHTSNGAHTITLDFGNGVYVTNKTFINNGVVPATPTSPGTSGEIAFNDNYFYRCIRNNQWVRTALSTW